MKNRKKSPTGFGAAVLLFAIIPISSTLAADPKSQDELQGQPIRAAVTRAISLLEKASAGSADKRMCFTCHSQAMPVISLAEAQRNGFQINQENLARQVEHTRKHLKRGKKAYESGKGQGGGVDTAGYALWTLEEAESKSNDVTSYVITWLLSKQREDGSWRTSSNRPPSEASDITATYLAVRALSGFGSDSDESAIQTALKTATTWLSKAKTAETEDLVFLLLSQKYVDVETAALKSAKNRLKQLQAEDGGWPQKPDMLSDPYATATALHALRQVKAIDPSSAIWKQGIAYLLKSQKEDGSWHVKSRSKPFQTYYETGFPHEKDQFISTSATSWAVHVLSQAVETEP